jgi:hypothetical protein
MALLQENDHRMTTTIAGPTTVANSPEDEKAARERCVLEEFARKAPLQIDLETIESRRPPEPDTRCSMDGEPVAFELVELCTQELAKNIGDQEKRGAEPKVILGSESAYSVCQSKLEKTYRSDAPIELLCFAGRTVTPDHLILDGL